MKGLVMVRFWHVVPILFAVALFVLLGMSSGLTMTQVRAVLNALTTGQIAAFFATSFANPSHLFVAHMVVLYNQSATSDRPSKRFKKPL